MKYEENYMCEKREEREAKNWKYSYYTFESDNKVKLNIYCYENSFTLIFYLIIILLSKPVS